MTARGNERRKTFRDDADRKLFLKTLAEAAKANGLQLHGRSGFAFVSAEIRLHDLVREETERLYAEISGQAFWGHHWLSSMDELPKRVSRYEALSEILVSVLVTGCHWGNEEQAKLWVSVLERIANPSEIPGRVDDLFRFRRYPSLILFYAAGMSASAAGNYATLAALFNGRVKTEEGNYREICSEVYPAGIMDEGVRLSVRLPSFNKHLFDLLRAPFREYLPDDDDYQGAFDWFEYLLGVVHADLNRQEVQGGWWGPVGSFMGRSRRIGRVDPESERFEAELTANGPNWPPLKAGLFGGDVGRARTAKVKFEIFLKGVKSQ